MTDDDMHELEELRAYKKEHGGNALNRAFGRLEQLLESPGFDPLVSIRAFRLLAECLFCLKDEVGK